MIIDLILDRKDGEPYNPREFYFSVMEYGGMFAERITRAMDEGTERDVKYQLCRYVLQCLYNEAICDYIESVNWLSA